MEDFLLLGLGSLLSIVKLHDGFVNGATRSALVRRTGRRRGGSRTRLSSCLLCLLVLSSCSSHFLGLHFGRFFLSACSSHGG